MLGSGAATHDGVGAEQVERQHLIDDWLEREAAPMRVARQCAADAQAIGASLLLVDPPLLRTTGLRPLELGQ